MCSVVEKIKRESLEEGIALGEERGMKRGMKLGEERGIKLGEERGMKLGEERGVQRGTEKTKREIVHSMYKTQMPLEVIAQICDMPVSKVRQILAIN